MALSQEKMDLLRARFDTCGIDLVRLQIDQSVQNGLAPTEEMAFARSWVMAEEAKSERKIQFIKGLVAIVFALLGGTIAVHLVF